MTDAETTKTIAIIGATTGILGSLLGITALSWDIYKWRNTEKRKLLVKAKQCRHTFTLGSDGGGGMIFREEDATCLEVSNPTKFEAVIDRIEFKNTSLIDAVGRQVVDAEFGRDKIQPSNREELVFRGEYKGGCFIVYDVLGNAFKSNQI